MVAFSKVACVAFAAGALASPLSPAPQFGTVKLFDELKSLPSVWKATGSVKKTAKVHAQIGLKQRNIEQLQKKLLEIANPEHADYGKWMSREEINKMTAPDAKDVAAVKTWLAAHGITETSQSSPDWISFTVPVSKMEELLNTKYEMFTHSTQGLSVARTTKYSVPQSLHHIIDLITPTTAFYERMPGTQPVKKTHKNATSKRQQSCDGSSITPACIKSFYNVDYTPTGLTKVGTTKFLNVGADHNDYSSFSSQYVDGGIKNDFADISIGGGTNPGAGGDLIEGNLDTQTAGGLANPNENDFIACGPDGSNDDAFNDGLANLASYLTSDSSAPSAVSTSYGGPENAYSGDYLDRICNEFMKAGAAGVSIFFSSGDSGVGPNAQDSCPGEWPSSWPASCPWTTAVGGTAINYDGSESVAQFSVKRPDGSLYDGGSGGGFSSHFSAPSYQSADTASYIKTLGSEYSGHYNPQGRGFPDISLVGLNYDTVINGQTQLVGGTSASSPAWAALVTILNDYRQSKGQSNLGFINPLLYGKGRSATRDVTSGNNRGCDGDGYFAAQGWDAATGLGTIDFGKLRALL